MLKRVRVEGRSMLPTLREGEVRWSNRWVYRFRAPRRGELVVVDHPTKALRLVKRVTHVPGDRVGERVLGPDEYLVRGDNPRETTDSSTFGPVPRHHIRARVLGPDPVRV